VLPNEEGGGNRREGKKKNALPVALNDPRAVASVDKEKGVNEARLAFPGSGGWGKKKKSDPFESMNILKPMGTGRKRKRGPGKWWKKKGEKEGGERSPRGGITEGEKIMKGRAVPPPKIDREEKEEKREGRETLLYLGKRGVLEKRSIFM